jgi:hypothetical protein
MCFSLLFQILIFFVWVVHCFPSFPNVCHGSYPRYFLAPQKSWRPRHAAQLASYALRLVCMGHDGGRVLHSFQEGTFDAEERKKLDKTCRMVPSSYKWADEQHQL